MLDIVHRSRSAVIAALLIALTFTGLAALQSSEARAATLAEGFSLRAPSGGMTYAGNQAVAVNGRTFTGPCIDPGLPGPRASSAPVLVVNELARFGPSFQRAARILNNPSYAPGSGKTKAAARWAALNLLLDGATGTTFRQRWESSYKAQLSRLDPAVTGHVQALLTESAKSLPANTYRFDSVSITPEQRGRQALASSGLSAVVNVTCPPECVAQGLVTVQARNGTRDTYLLQLLNTRNGAELYRSELKPDQVSNAIPRLPDGTLVKATLRKWANGAWQAPRLFAAFEVVCPTPPKVSVEVCTRCDGTTASVVMVNTTRRPAVLNVRVGGVAQQFTVAPGASLPSVSHRIAVPTLIEAHVYMLNAQGKATGVVVITELEVRPGRSTPVPV